MALFQELFLQDLKKPLSHLRGTGYRKMSSFAEEKNCQSEEVECEVHKKKVEGSFRWVSESSHSLLFTRL